MGRKSTRAWTTRECRRLELSFLLKNGYLKRGYHIQGTIEWTDGSDVRFESKYSKKEKWLRLMYVVNRSNGDKYPYDYRIYLTEVESNLGKGYVPYFLCPETEKRYRILYQAYGAHKWKSREDFQHQIYYPSQVSSKMNYPNDRYWALEKQIEKIEQEPYLKLEYDGRPTRKAKRLERLKYERAYWDRVRWLPRTMPLSLRREMTKSGGQLF
jgi:hypothetical protein